MTENTLTYRVGFLGIPHSIERFQIQKRVAWDKPNIARLQKLGFNTIQLNLAWGARPADEPLNLEDVVELTAEQARQYPQPVPLNCDPSPQRREARRAELRQRIALCRGEHLRTIFHFGAPYNAHCRFGDGPPNCISDEKVTIRHELLIDAFAADFPGVDDLLIYTYDQDAWLCSEFGPCQKCLGVPLHQRLVPFLARLTARWQRHNPNGRIWWEPWELSAGQVYACVERLPVEGFGLSLHSNIAEVMATMPVDRWLKNTVSLAKARNIPVIVEHWLGGASEELESLLHLSQPLVTLRALKAINALPGVGGIKEYYGLSPEREDPNLRMTGLFFANPQITEEQAMAKLAEPYGPTAKGMIEFWQLSSAGMELFPWDISWYTREVGRSATNHSLAAAFLRGQQCHTPSWDSTRAAIFMKTDSRQPHPWMLEDVQLRFALAADRWLAALHLGQSLRQSTPPPLLADFDLNLLDLGRLQRRATAYVYHLRATNLVTIMRRQIQEHHAIPARVRQELLSVLEADRQNHQTDLRATLDNPDGKALAGAAAPAPWAEIDSAIALLKTDLDRFLATYFLETEEVCQRGQFSVTSR